MFVLKGQKNKRIFKKILYKFFPQEIHTYVEPFGGTFNIGNFLGKVPKVKVYNDINTYPINIQADYVHHLDYKEVIKMYDSVNSVFYLDPPYYGKEYLYGLKKNN